MWPKFIIIDDFVGDFDSYRKYALAVPYELPGHNAYAGKNSETPHLSDEVVHRLKLAIGRDIEPSPGKATGHFRISCVGDQEKQHIHFDMGVHGYAGVLYLNTEEQCCRPDGAPRPGTRFWRHKRLGWETFPLSPDEAQRCGYNSIEDIARDVIFKDGHDEGLWHLTELVSMKPNRLVLFSAYLWHSVGEIFGNSDEDGRLTQVFFLDVK
jgi:hypothetical protein